MYLDESLAKALASRLLQDAKEASDRAVDLHGGLVRNALSPIFESIGRWQAHLQDMVGCFKGLTLAQARAGKAKKSEAFLYVLANLQQNVGPDWDESALTIYALYCHYPNILEVEGLPIACIGQHAIARIIQRTPFPPVHTLTGDALYARAKAAVAAEISFLASWSRVYSHFFTTEKAMSFKGAVEFIVPTPHGVLLGRFISKRPVVDIRTYVPDALLAPQQREIRYQMLTAMSPHLQAATQTFSLHQSNDRIRGLTMAALCSMLAHRMEPAWVNWMSSMALNDLSEYDKDCIWSSFEMHLKLIQSDPQLQQLAKLASTRPISEELARLIRRRVALIEHTKSAHQGLPELLGGQTQLQASPMMREVTQRMSDALVERAVHSMQQKLQPNR